MAISPLADPDAVPARTGVLVATDVRSDADLLRRQIGSEFGSIVHVEHIEKAGTDFETHRPRVLLLAFNSLFKAQQYSLALYRHSALPHDVPHRTLILCTKEEVGSAYSLCEKEIYDDYVLYWPLSHDGQRLKMSVLLAMRHLAAAERSSSASRFARQARRIASLESMLAQVQHDLDQALGAVDATAPVARGEVVAALDAFTDDVASGRYGGAIELRDSAAFTAQAQRFREDRLDAMQRQPPITSAIHDWRQSFGERVRPHLEAVRDLTALSERFRPRVLLVDDDELQFKLLSAQLRGEPYELDWVANADSALRTVARQRPDVMLLDIDLPDLPGPELLRRLRATEAGRDVPVIIVSGRTERPTVVEAIQAGANSFVVKPVERALLLQRLSATLAAG